MLGFLQVLVATLTMSFRLVALGLGGFYLVKRGVIDKNVSRKMGGVIVDFLTPCLIFGKIIPNFDITNWEAWVPVLGFAYFCIFLGISLGYIFSLICRMRSRSQRNLMAVLMGFAHTGSIQLTLAITLQDTLDQIGGDADCRYSQQDELCPSERATTYIVLVWVLSATLRWSLGYSMLAPQQEEQPLFTQTIPAETIPAESIPDESSFNGHSSASSSQADIIPEEILNYERKMLPRYTEISNIAATQISAPITSTTKQSGPKKLDCKQRCNKTMNPPVIVSIVSLTIASIPYTKQLFWPSSAIFYSTIMATARFIGQANYIVMIIVLGANLSIFKNEKTKIPIKVHFFLAFFRLIVYPCVGIAVVYYGGYRGGLIQDKMMAFVLMLMYATPPANNLMIMATMQKNLESDLAKNLLIAYLSSIITLTLYVAFFMYIIQM